MGWLQGDKLVAVVTLALVVVTAASLLMTWRLAVRQERLQKTLADNEDKREALRRDIDKQIADDAARQKAERLSLETRLSEIQLSLLQRSQIIPLWQYISSLSDINPTEPVTPAVVNAANTLEFIAICCESGVVDSSVIMRTFRDKYMELYAKIEQCGNLPGYTNPTMNGRQLINQNRAARQLFNELDKENLEQDRLAPLTKAGRIA